MISDDALDTSCCFGPVPMVRSGSNRMNRSTSYMVRHKIAIAGSMKARQVRPRWSTSAYVFGLVRSVMKSAIICTISETLRQRCMMSDLTGTLLATLRVCCRGRQRNENRLARLGKRVIPRQVRRRPREKRRQGLSGRLTPPTQGVSLSRRLRAER